MGNTATEESSVVEELAKELANEFRKVSDKPLQKACEELITWMISPPPLHSMKAISAGYIRKKPNREIIASKADVPDPVTDDWITRQG